MKGLGRNLIFALLFLLCSLFSYSADYHDQEKTRQLKLFLTIIHEAWGNENRDIALFRRKVRDLVEQGADKNITIANKSSAIHFAAQAGISDMVEFLLSDTNIETPGAYGRTPIFWATRFGQEPVVAMLIEKGANINVNATNRRPLLMEAIEEKYECIAALLIEKGVNIHVRDWDGMTPLMKASQKGLQRIVAMLIDKKADIEATDASGFTSLLLASQWGHVEVAAMLIEMGSNIEAKTKDGLTSLLLAIQYGRHEIAVLLIEKGADIEARDVRNATPVMRAARTGSYKSTILLVDAGANLRAKDVNGNTAVDLASGRTVQFFKAYDNRTEAGENWFYTQMRIGDYNALSAIFQIHKSQDSLEPLVHQYDSERRTPLDIALASGNETAIRFLLNNGADPRKGKFNGLRWAREIPEWSSSSGTTPSIYEAIYLTYAIYHFQESQLFSELPKEVQAHIAHFLFILMVPVIEH